jgi:hypothetical protein
VVPVSDLLQQSFAAELRRIERGLAAAATALSPATGLALHVFRLASCTVPEALNSIPARFPDGGLDDAPQIATAGFAVKSTAPTEEQLVRWREGLRRLSKRQVFTRDHQTFAFRPAELVGIALGIQITEPHGTAFREWLVNVVTRLSSEEPKASAWNVLWNGYAASLMDVAWTHPLPARFDDLETIEVALLLVLLSSGVRLSIPGFAEFNRADLESALLRRVALSPVDERQVERLAVLHAALSLAIRSQLERHLSASDGLRGGTRDALQILELICRNFDRFVRALQKRHDNRPAFEVNDEYDVQDLMHGLLLLHFDVVIPEDTAPARAGNKSRLDFLLKRERVVVETKMTRKSLRQSDAHNELVADRDRYKSHPDCDVLVCLVYDPERLFHNAAAFELDLNSDKDHPRMRAFVCPQ